MTNLQIGSCLKGYPATMCCADELPTHVGQAPHVHRQYGHVRRLGKSLGGVSLPLVGPAELFYSLGNTPETYRHGFAIALIVNGQQ